LFSCVFDLLFQLGQNFHVRTFAASVLSMDTYGLDKHFGNSNGENNGLYDETPASWLPNCLERNTCEMYDPEHPEIGFDDVGEVDVAEILDTFCSPSLQTDRCVANLGPMARNDRVSFDVVSPDSNGGASPPLTSPSGDLNQQISLLYDCLVRQNVITLPCFPNVPEVFIGGIDRRVTKDQLWHVLSGQGRLTKMHLKFKQNFQFAFVRYEDKYSAWNLMTDISEKRFCQFLGPRVIAHWNNRLF